jgi:hypothetical protein
MPTPVSRAVRYIHPEVARVYWLPAVADVNAPTRVEIEAVESFDLTQEIADAPGWGIAANRTPVPDLGTKFTGRVAGRIDPEDAQMVFYASSDTEDIRSVLSRGDRGFVYIAHGGDVPTQLADCYPVEVVSVSKPLSVGGDPAQITVDFAVTAKPGEDVVIPAETP